MSPDRHKKRYPECHTLIIPGLPRWLCGLRRCHWLLAISHHWGPAWWPCGLRHCHWLLAISHHWGPAVMAVWSKVLPLTASCQIDIKRYSECHTLYRVLPWWLCGLTRCHWLLAISHHWGPVPMAVWSKALPLTASCLSILRACPDGRVV